MHTTMGICYYCGKEIDPPKRCPYCNLSFCDEHLSPKAHNCIALSQNIQGIQPKPVIKTINYVETEESPKPMPRKTKRKTSILGQGITKSKLLIVVLTLAVSIASIAMLNQWEPEEEDNPTVGPVFPVSQKTIKQQEYVLSLINKERAKEKLPLLALDNYTIAQRYAEDLLRTGVVKNNPELPVYMGENLMVFKGEEFNVTEVLDALMYDMVYDDSDYNWGNRKNILYEGYTKVSIGVAYDDKELYLVMDFS